MFHLCVEREWDHGLYTWLCDVMKYLAQEFSQVEVKKQVNNNLVTADLQ